MKRPYFFLLLIFLTFAFILASCEQEKTVQMRVGSNIWPGYEGLYLADKQGFFEGSGIRIIAYPTSTTASRDFRSGLLEAVALTLDEAFLLASEKVPFKIVLIFDFSNGGDVIISDKKISSFKELKGGKIGLEVTALGAFVLSRALELNGMKPSDVIQVNIPLNQQEEALRNHTVDAVVTFDPVATRLLADGFNRVFDSSMIPGEIVDVLVVQESFLKQHPKAVSNLLKGYFRALDYQKANFTKSVSFLSEREGVSPEQYIKSLSGLTIPTLAKNKLIFGENRNQFVSTLQKLIKVMKRHKLLLEPIHPEKLLDGSVVKGLNF